MAAFTISSSLNLDNPRPSYTEVRRVTMAAKTNLDASGLASVITASGFNSPGQLLTAFSRTTVVGTMRVRRLSVQPVPNSTLDIFDVTMSADTDYQWLTPKAGTGSRQYVLSVASEWEHNEREVELWRTSYTTQPSANLNGNTDIGGTSTTTGGKPITKRINVTDCKVTMIIDTSAGPSNIAQVRDTISLVKDKWNSANFVGFAPNTVFCTAANIVQMREEFYRVTYQFRRDEWFDCVQEPRRDIQGQIFFQSGTDDPSTVYWRSETRGTYDLNAIFNDTFDSTIAKDMAAKGSFLS